jgi:hypothetical protein
MYSQKGIKRNASLIILSLVILYFSVFSVFQLGKYEGNDYNFYLNIKKRISREDLVIFVNKNIYETKYGKNFNDYVAGPLKYFFDLNVLVLEEPEQIQTELVHSFFKKHDKVFYLSNVSLKEYNFANDEEQITLNYNYFNNSPGCNYHNYEFLETVDVREIPLPDSLKCKLLPNAYFINKRDFYFGDLIYPTN